MKTGKKGKRPKKGVMPPALAKYWRAHRRGASKHKAKRAAHRRRRKNPSPRYRLAIQRGSNKGTRLYFDGVKFSRFNRAAAFGSLALVTAKANALRKKYKALARWAMYAVPARY